MTDEQFGRAWARMTGRHPVVQDVGGARFWTWPASPPDSVVDYSDMRLLRTASDAIGVHMNEAAAYHALGAAVRAVHAAVPPLREPKPRG